MTRIVRTATSGDLWCGSLLLAVSVSAGCAATRSSAIEELELRSAIEHYSAARTDELDARGPRSAKVYTKLPLGLDGPSANAGSTESLYGGGTGSGEYPALGMFPSLGQEAPQSRPTTTQALGVPADYWRESLWRQSTDEFKDLVTHDFWRGFKTSFWDLENALALTATMGASVAIRGTGVDDTVRDRVLGHRQLGDMDETIQILGHPGTHFAGAGVLWLTSTLTQDVKQHEVAKSLTQALAVNGVTTLVLKGAANTRAPDGEPFAWPSGHTSSAFTVASVLNEHYGPWVGVPSFALAGLVGYQRIDSRVHDFSDVVFGAVLGYVVGTSIASDNEARFPELFGMQVVPFADPETGTSGIALMKRF